MQTNILATVEESETFCFASGSCMRNILFGFLSYVRLLYPQTDKYEYLLATADTPTQPSLSHGQNTIQMLIKCQIQHTTS